MPENAILEQRHSQRRKLNVSRCIVCRRSVRQWRVHSVRRCAYWNRFRDAADPAILSAAIGKGLQVRSGANRVTRGNLYVLLSAESGSGKSDTFRHAAKPFQRI